MGYVDTFRHVYPDEAERYTWWTVRSNARARNVGWRIDYVILTEDFITRPQRCIYFIRCDGFRSLSCWY